MQNSMVKFTFSVLDQKYLFWANLVQKLKIFCWIWDFASRLTQRCKMLWLFLLFYLLFNTFSVNLVKKFKIVSLNESLIPRLISVWKFSGGVLFFCFGLEILLKTSIVSMGLWWSNTPVSNVAVFTKPVFFISWKIINASRINIFETCWFWY